MKHTYVLRPLLGGCMSKDNDYNRIIDLLNSASNIAYTNYFELSIALHMVVNALVLEDMNTLKKITDAIKLVGNTEGDT